MKQSAKPVRRCHACLLNLDDHCWLYAYPRGQWRHGRRCGARENKEAHDKFREWQDDTRAKTGKELRRMMFRKKEKPARGRLGPDAGRGDRFR